MNVAKHLLMLNVSAHATSTTHRIRHLIEFFLSLDWVFVCSSDMIWNT